VYALFQTCLTKLNYNQIYEKIPYYQKEKGFSFEKIVFLFIKK